MPEICIKGEFLEGLILMTAKTTFPLTDLEYSAETRIEKKCFKTKIKINVRILTIIISPTEGYLK